MYQKIVGISMDIYCAPFVADLYVIDNVRHFMFSLSDNHSIPDMIEVFNSQTQDN